MWGIEGMRMLAMGREDEDAARIAWINRRRERSQEPRASYGIGAAWYCYRCDVGCDERAWRGLTAIGYDCWVPKMQVTVRHARKVEEVERPLFPRHGFIRVDPNRQGFGLVLRCRGVESVLGITGTPSSIPEAVIHSLMGRAGVGAFDYRDKPATGPKVGERVEIAGDGPFRDWVVKVAEEMDDDRRVGILLKLFNSYRVIKISLDDLREHKQGDGS